MNIARQMMSSFVYIIHNFFVSLMCMFFDCTKNSLNNVQESIEMKFFTAQTQHIILFAYKLNFSVHYYYMRGVIFDQKTSIFSFKMTCLIL